MAIQGLLTEKVRPKKLGHIILLDRIAKSIGDGDIQQDMLFIGSAGIGKTSLMRILANEHDYKYINASEERGIDTVRETIVQYCSTVSAFGIDKQKYVLLDEIDGAADGFYKAIRATKERFPNVRFLATCNFLNKIPDPVQSRFLPLEFDPKNSDEQDELYDKYTQRIKAISSKIRLEWESDDVILEFVKLNFPDMRRIVSKVQDFQIAGEKITMENIKTLNYKFNDLFKLVLATVDPKKTYEYVVREYKTKVNDVMASFGTEFPDWIQQNSPKHIMFLPAIIILVADYQVKRQQVIDPVVALLAMIFQIQQVIAGKK